MFLIHVEPIQVPDLEQFLPNDRLLQTKHERRKNIACRSPVPGNSPVQTLHTGDESIN